MVSGADRAGEDGYEHRLRVLDEGRQVRLQDGVPLVPGKQQVFIISQF